MSWSIVHVDLSRGRPVVPEGRGPAFVVFWWRSLPLGAEAFAREALPLSRDRVLALAARHIAAQLCARLPGLGGIPEAGDDGRPEVRPELDEVRLSFDATSTLDALGTPADAPADDLSVVVCTRDRPDMLWSCLASLAVQRSPPGEIIVVDNSRSGSAEAICSRFPGVRHIRHHTPGLSGARNAGVAASSRPLIAFTDDDVEADPGWTAELVRAMASAPDAEAFTGLVLPASLATHAQRFFELRLGGFGTGYVPLRFGSRFVAAGLRRGLQVWRIGAGANMAFRREVFSRLGGFDERLGAGAAGCSEDSELWYRILAGGGACLYEPRAVVHHHHRRDWSALESQMRAYLRGHVAALAVQHARHGHRGNVRRIAVQLPRHFARTAFHAFADASGDQARLLAHEVRGWLGGLGLALRSAWRADPATRPRREDRAPIGSFLARNPFPHPLTGGLFYREKMRAIHRVAPRVLGEAPGRVLEIGGGQSGLGALLYPQARITTVDVDRSVLGQGPEAEALRCGFVCGDARRLPFPSGAFDVVTLFDVLEHIPDDAGAVMEAQRVTRQGGWILVSTPVARWRYPYHRIMRRWCPPEEKLMAEWGHVRRGYSIGALARLFGSAPDRSTTFINALTAFFHDVGFSRLSPRTRRLLYGLGAPAALVGYLIHGPRTAGLERALAWRKQGSPASAAVRGREAGARTAAAADPTSRLQDAAAARGG